MNMKIVSGTAPFLRRPRKTSQIMTELLIGLGVIFLAAVIYNFTLGLDYGFKTIGIMAISIVFTLISDIIAGSLRYKKDKDGEFADYLLWFIKENFSVVTAVIFALTVPVGTPLYVVAVGAIFATLLVKHAFGGFGSNIFNPAALGRIFLALAFGSQLTAYLPGDASAIGHGLNAGATVTSQFVQAGTKFLSGNASSINISLFDLWLGNHSGALGETFTLLILLVGVALAAREVINWRTPVFLFGTVLVSSIFIALIAGVSVGEYLLLQFGLGGLMFGAIFMFTDPVTSPTSNFGKALIGIIGGFLNVLIRVAGNLPEGTAFSIALVNVFSPMIDKLITGRTDTKLWVPYTTSGVALLLSVGILTGVTACKDPVSIYQDYMNALNISEKPSGVQTTTVHEYLTENGISARYDVKKGNSSLGIVYEGTIEGFAEGLNFMVGFNDNKYAGFHVLSHNETPEYGADYLPKVNDLIKGRPITAEVLTGELHTGVTITHDALKSILELCADDYGGTLVVPDPTPDPTSIENLRLVANNNLVDSFTLLPLSDELKSVGTKLKYALYVGEEVAGTAYELEVKGYRDGLHFLASYKDGKHLGFFVIESRETDYIGGVFLEKIDDYLQGLDAGEFNFDDLDDGAFVTGYTKTRAPVEAALTALANDHLLDEAAFLDQSVLNEALNTTTGDSAKLKKVSASLVEAGTLRKYEVFASSELLGVVYEAQVKAYRDGLHFLASFKDGKHAGFYIIDDNETDYIGGVFLEKIDDYLQGLDAGEFNFDDLDDGAFVTGYTKTRNPVENLLALFASDYLSAEPAPAELFRHEITNLFKQEQFALEGHGA